MERNPPAAVTQEEKDAVERAERGLTAGAELRREHLLPLLQGVQRERGWLSRGALAYVADRLGLPFPDVWGVATFYALLRLEPPTGVAVHVCDDVPCRLRGAEALLAELEGRYGPPRRFTGRVHGAEGAAPSERAAIDWETVPCLGQCDGAPVAVVGGKVLRGCAAEAITRAAGGERGA